MEFSTEIIIFILSAFIGYYIVWGITPSLHAPLMSVSNAISGIVILGAISVLNESPNNTASFVGFLAIIFASINIFGGFAISQRMLQLFKPKNFAQAKKDQNDKS